MIQQAHEAIRLSELLPSKPQSLQASSGLSGWREAQTIFCLENVLWSLLTRFGDPKLRIEKSRKKKCEGCCLKGSSGSPKAIQGPILQPCSSHCAAILKIWTLFVSSLKEKIAEKNGQRQIAANSGKKKQTPANTGQQQPNALCTFSRFFWTSVLF